MTVMSSDPRRGSGHRGEELAARHLERQGWRIVARNHRTREGEIDLIATRRGVLAFCEVKTLVARGGTPASGPAHPLECVGPAKRIRLRRLARAWLAQRRQDERRVWHRAIRLDVIGVLLAPDGTLLRLDHVESAF
jgi:putative endonuclease